eukprot:Rhum_TRINITY_DN14740_c1_g2::Rhum_TRINITY_DN14740_c1_g2_i1::g.114428::m.114428
MMVFFYYIYIFVDFLFFLQPFGLSLPNHDTGSCLLVQSLLHLLQCNAPVHHLLLSRGLEGECLVALSEKPGGAAHDGETTGSALLVRHGLTGVRGDVEAVLRLSERRLRRRRLLEEVQVRVHRQHHEVRREGHKPLRLEDALPVHQLRLQRVDQRRCLALADVGVLACGHVRREAAILLRDLEAPRHLVRLAEPRAAQHRGVTLPRRPQQVQRLRLQRVHLPQRRQHLLLVRLERRHERVVLRRVLPLLRPHVGGRVAAGQRRDLRRLAHARLGEGSLEGLVGRGGDGVGLLNLLLRAATRRGERGARGVDRRAHRGQAAPRARDRDGLPHVRRPVGAPRRLEHRVVDVAQHVLVEPVVQQARRVRRLDEVLLVRALQRADKLRVQP